MSRPADLPGREHFERMPCGTRAKYVGAKCRCVPCRAAASRYESERLAKRKAGEWNGLVPAEPVRVHLGRLSRQGVGYKSAADAAGVSRSTVGAILAGRRTQLRAQAAKRLLAVDREAVADHALVPAVRTWRLIEQLLKEGFTKTELARRLGSSARAPALQLRRDYVTAVNASKVERLYRQVMAE